MNEQANSYSLRLRCIDNTNYPISLTIGKIYAGKIIQRGALGVIDDSGEAYAYSKRLFEIVDEPNAE